MNRLRKLGATISFYPMASLGTVVVAMMMAYTLAWVSLGQALLGQLLLATTLTFLAQRRELRIVHLLVNERQNELLARIDQLTLAMQAAGIPVPVTESQAYSQRRDRRAGDRKA